MSLIHKSGQEQGHISHLHCICQNDSSIIKTAVMEAQTDLQQTYTSNVEKW